MKHKHHIIPKYMGGGDEPTNLVEVTIEEHANLHLDLYFKYGNWQDWRAAWGLIGLDEEMYAAHSVAMSGSNNPMYGLRGELHPASKHTYTKEQRQKRSENLKNNNPMSNPESRKKISIYRTGRANKNYKYSITFVDGNQEIVTNLKNWCRLNKRNYSNVLKVKNGKWKKCNDIISVIKI